MSKVDVWADLCWDFLDGHRNRGYQIQQLIAGIQAERDVVLRNNATLRTALHRVRDRAIAEGKFLPYPVAANDYTWAVVDDPNMAYDSALHCHREVAGWRNAEDKHTTFLRSKAKELPRKQRRIIELVAEFRDTQQKQERLLNEMIGIEIERQREERKGHTDD